MTQTLKERVMEAAQQVSHAETDEQALLELFCEAAIRRLTELLRDGMTPEDCGAAFICAASLLASADLLTGRGGSRRLASFTAGDFSVREEGAETDEMEAMYQTVHRLMGPYVKDSGFGFYGVRG